MIEIKSLPKSPGCYIFKDDRNKILYIGKAKNIQKRVASYFNKSHEDSKTKILVSKIHDVDTFVTSNEVEALVLENNLIKKHRPPYNINLKDSKGYAYIKITDEKYPRLIVARKKDDSGEYFGPFTSGQARDFLLEALRRIFKIRTCKRLPKRECVRYAIGLCSAPCTEKISHTEYMEDIHSAKLVLKGKIKKLVIKLDARMKNASRDMNYEKAMEYRNQINAAKALLEKQNVEREVPHDEDIINFVIDKGKVNLLIFNTRKGILENKMEFEFEGSSNFLEEFLIQHYSDSEIPKEIIIPESVDGIISDYLTKVKGSKVKVISIKKGKKKELLDLVKRNIEISLFGDLEKLEDLQKRLKLNDYPKVIECFDISHLGGKDTVASMVQFRDGQPDKENYRRFKIQMTDGIDDFASMSEVVSRRYSRLKFEGKSFPNLIVIDGGKGQLSSALQVLEKLKIKIPIIALAKREEEIFIPGRSNSIKLPKNSKALKLLIQIRDEAHRFAINYQKLLRSKKIRK